MPVAVSIEHVSKSYRLGAIGGGTLNEDLARWWARVRGKPDPFLKVDQLDRVTGDTFWALRDVSFEVNEGDILGIVGRNGAGKSTLLKILSQVTGPTSGEIRLRGRLASLLEVGTGFHPELTGRENVFLNGAILGMTKREIRQKMDEIISFARIEDFADTPVKRYSSGMYVRLAFAVAAHLEPEILVLDEVLAVGDAAFQKKCLGKMGEVASGGRTVLFVSHNMQAVLTLCHQAVWIDDGRVVKSGSAEAVVGAYLKHMTVCDANREQQWTDPPAAPGNDRIRLHRIRTCAETDDPSQELHLDTPICIEVDYWNLVPDTRIVVNLILYGLDGSAVLEDWTVDERHWHGRGFPTGLFRTRCRIPANLLNEGTYQFGLVFFDLELGRTLYHHRTAGTLTITDIAERTVPWFGRFVGPVHPKLSWVTERLGDDDDCRGLNELAGHGRGANGRFVHRDSSQLQL